MRSKNQSLKKISKKRGRRWLRNNNKKQLKGHSRMLTSLWLRVTMILNKKEFRMQCAKWLILEEQACVSHLKMKIKDFKILPLIVMSTRQIILITRVNTIRECMIFKHLKSKKHIYHKNKMVSKLIIIEDAVNKTIIIIERLIK